MSDADKENLIVAIIAMIGALVLIVLFVAACSPKPTGYNLGDQCGQCVKGKGWQICYKSITADAGVSDAP